MVKIIEENKYTSNDIYPKDNMNDELIHGTLRDFVQDEDGVMFRIERCLKPKKTYPSEKSTNIPLNINMVVVSELSEARVFDLDDEGQYQYEKDSRTGKDVEKVKIDYGTGCTVFYRLYSKVNEKVEEFSDDLEFTFKPYTKSYSIVSEAYKAKNLLPSDFCGVFATDFAEFEKVLTNFTFWGEYDELKFKKSNNTVEYIKCVRAVDEDDGRDAAVAATEKVTEE